MRFSWWRFTQPAKASTRKCRAWGMAGGYMAQTRPSPTLSRGFTRLGRFLAPYGIAAENTGAQDRDQGRAGGLRSQAIASAARGLIAVIRLAPQRGADSDLPSYSFRPPAMTLCEANWCASRLSEPVRHARSDTTPGTSEMPCRAICRHTFLRVRVALSTALSAYRCHLCDTRESLLPASRPRA